MYVFVCLEKKSSYKVYTESLLIIIHKGMCSKYGAWGYEVNLSNFESQFITRSHWDYGTWLVWMI